jgi:VWFA-related protein
LLFLSAIVWCLFPCTSLLAQTSQKTDSIYTLRVYQDLVIVDVIVTGKDGKPLRNLRREDFTILEDKVPQSISTFDFEDLSQTVTSAPQPSSLGRPIDLSKTPIDRASTDLFQNRRLLVLMFDLSAMPVEDQVQAQKTAQDFIEKQMTPADLVAIVTNTSNLKLLQNFTNDREALLTAVRKLMPGESSSLAETGTADPDAAGSTIEDRSDSFVADETQFNIFNTDRKLSAIESVGKMFGELPERKFLVHFSSGIETTGTENQAQLRSTVDSLNQANASLYTVDARGLIAAPPGGDASKGSASGDANYSGRAVRNQMASISNSQETLTTLALDTGGKALLDTNDLGQVFEAVREDSGSYYLLGYYSTNSKRDGKYRQIKVQVKLPGVRVKNRAGYFAPKSFEQFTKSDRERQLEEAVSTERPFSELPFAVTAHFVKADPQRVFVPIGLQFSAADVPFHQKGSKVQAEFDFVGQVRDSKNIVVSAIRDTIRVSLDSASSQRPSTRQLQYMTAFYLKPGRYDLKFLVRENQTGKLSTFEQPLSVPNYFDSKLSMSSIVLSNRLQAVTQKNDAVRRVADFQGLPKSQDNQPDPLVVDQNRIIPTVTRVFSRKDTLYVFFQTYLVKGQAAPNLSQSLVFYRNGTPFREAANQQLTQFDDGSRDTVTSELALSLASFPQGQYVLQVNTIDPISQESLIQRTSFAVR